ncbi:MAG: spore protease YyaC [Limnochordia bacterium]|jgi:putative sporulation protein YyaC|nr:spore protease YyaC [Bacillota bacterium]
MTQRGAPGRGRQRARVHYAHPFAAETIAAEVSAQLAAFPRKAPVIICIGTDRSTGDSLGPLIGSQLSAAFRRELAVYGTLDEPVHATNLMEHLLHVEQVHPDQPVLAIDACLGTTDSVGMISVKEGPLLPGTGVNKELPPVGHFHIVGVVNVAGFMEFFVLQNTRLSMVMKMAQTICSGLTLGLRNLQLPSPGACPVSGPLDAFPSRPGSHPAIDRPRSKWAPW